MSIELPNHLTREESAKPRIRTRKAPDGGWYIEVGYLYGVRWHWFLKRWTSGNKSDALKAEREVIAEMTA